MIKKRIWAELALLAVAIMWGGGFVGVKGSLDDVGPITMVAIRFLGASIILSLLFIKRLRHIRRHEMKGGLIIGCFLFIGFALQTIGLQYTLPGKQAFITGVYVIMVPFLYWLVKKKSPDSYSILAAILTLIGIGMITLQESFRLNSGDWLTLLCDVGFAAHIIAIDKYAADSDTVVLAIVQMYTAAFLALVCSLLFESWPETISPSGLLSLGYVVLFSTMLAFLLQNMAQKYVPPTSAAIILSLESVFGAFFSVIFMQEIFTSSKILGCAVILIAIILSQTKMSPPAVEETEVNRINQPF